MAKKFDAALKELIDGYDAEWGRYLAGGRGSPGPGDPRERRFLGHAPG